jgi:hypothetical protein
LREKSGKCTAYLKWKGIQDLAPRLIQTDKQAPRLIQIDKERLGRDLEKDVKEKSKGMHF